MRVLMLGWDFSPRLSGGVGSACQGLANALARAGEPLHAEVLFVLPRVRGDEEPENVRLLAGDQAQLVRAPAEAAVPAVRAVPGRKLALAPQGASTDAPTTRAASAPETRALSRETPDEPNREPSPVLAPTLPSPAEALRLLAIDSPLRPYLSHEDYTQVVQALLARIRRTARRPVPQSAMRRAAPPGPPPLAGEEPAPSAGHSAAEVSPAPREDPGEVRVPPYGRTLLAEVERYARAALALVQGEGFDVIHAHDWMTFPAGLLLQERTGKPLVVHFHSSEFERRGPQGSGDVRAIEQAALDAAERVLCVSEASARTLRAHYALEYARLRVLHNALTPLARAAPRANAAPDAERDGPVVLYLGRLSEQKSPDVFLRAAARVHARHPTARFVLAGAGELYPELEALAAELDLASRVHFTGFVAGEELVRTYAGADVYVLSSTAEPFGISALEALSLGVPTVVPRGAGVAEVVRSVLRFEPGDVAALADKIVALLERPALRSQLSAAGLREVKKIRWDRPARALRGIYAEIARAAP